MRVLIPPAGILGLVASALAIAFWIAEQTTRLMIFELLTRPIKLILLAAPLLFISDLSAFLHRKPRTAVALYLTLLGVTVGAMILYLPWRSSFAAHFNNDVYRWYYESTPHAASMPAFNDWISLWNRRIPHFLESGLVALYYFLLITSCTFWRINRIVGVILGSALYLLLYWVPVFTGLIVWDYDNFLKGIAFDSISMDLHPVLISYAGDHSIFLYSFFLLFFSTTAFFFTFRKQNAAKSGELSA